MQVDTIAELVECLSSCSNVGLTSGRSETERSTSATVPDTANERWALAGLTNMPWAVLVGKPTGTR